jgi:hypothetical protein
MSLKITRVWPGFVSRGEVLASTYLTSPLRLINLNSTSPFPPGRFGLEKEWSPLKKDAGHQMNQTEEVKIPGVNLFFFITGQPFKGWIDKLKPAGEAT